MSLSMGLEVLLGASDITVPTNEAPEVVKATTGAKAGFALAEMPDIPILPVRESSNPPTEGDELVTTSGSAKSPVTISPKVCATTQALENRRTCHQRNNQTLAK